MLKATRGGGGAGDSVVEGVVEGMATGEENNSAGFKYFIRKCRAQHGENFPNARRVSYAQWSFFCGKRWQTMTLGEKSYFENMSISDDTMAEEEDDDDMDEDEEPPPVEVEEEDDGDEDEEAPPVEVEEEDDGDEDEEAPPVEAEEEEDMDEDDMDEDYEPGVRPVKVKKRKYVRKDKKKADNNTAVEKEEGVVGEDEGPPVKAKRKYVRKEKKAEPNTAMSLMVEEEDVVDEDERSINAKKKRVRKIKKKVDPNAPKRTVSAFFWFCREKRPIIMEKNPTFGLVDASPILGRMWKKSNRHVKAKYQEMSDKDHVRFLAEKAAYDQKKIKGEI